MNSEMDPNAIKRGREIIARLDRIPIWPYPKHVMLTVGIGFFFSFYDILTIGLSLPSIEKAFGVSLHAATWAITSGLIGYIIGSFINSRISDKFGRHLSLYFSIGAFTIGSILTAVSPDLAWVIIWRFISGMGIGAEIAAVITYMEELSPSAVRGKATSLAIAFGMFGFAIIPFVALYFIPTFTWGWRLLFLLGGAGGVVIFFMRKYLPDSPRWLFLHERLDEADAIISKAEDFARHTLGTELAPPGPISDYPLVVESSIAAAFKKPLLHRVILFAAIWFIYYIGNYGWLTLATSLFYHHGFKLATSIAFVAISSLGFVFGSLFVTLLSDRIERKWLCAGIAFVWSVALLVVGWFPIAPLIMIGGFVAATSIAMIIPIMYIYTGENFPTRIRQTCVAITDGVGHLGGAFCGQIIFGIAGVFAATQLRFAMAFTTMAITGFLTVVLLLFGMRMTKRSLSELSKPTE